MAEADDPGHGNGLPPIDQPIRPLPPRPLPTLCRPPTHQSLSAEVVLSPVRSSVLCQAQLGDTGMSDIEHAIWRGTARSCGDAVGRQLSLSVMPRRSGS